ncbi:glutathione S-transferase [Pigmentiphaga sp. NML080357]|uniref:glutathione S-transferase family protein n=1 Tax=Pigmentiphaga sp. NML080357 TaxID=2008675 RepID=UPI000B41B279|nr:glutathione S-transferase family protein [Pigmentiphaga sp. NML080357]OVZ55376.1 glutathione S-transferase [Pigmentiphaga sp. NML080357]
MNDELVFYTHPMSRGRIARWMLEEVGQPYRIEVLDFATSMKSLSYRAINPMGKVPAIRHGDTVVTEAAAICAYLADAFPQAGLAPPPSSPLRGPYYRWMFFCAGPVEAAVTNQALGISIPEDRQRMVGYGTLAATLDTLESAVAGDAYVAGDRFTAADVYVGSQLAWGMMFGTIEKRPAYERYVRRVTSRPAAARAAQLDDELGAALKSGQGG